MSMDKMFSKWGGGEVLKKAVRGMLPKNRLRDKRLARLKVFEGLAHPYKENLVKFAGRTHVVTQIPDRTTKSIEAIAPRAMS